MSAGTSHGWIAIFEALLAQLSREEVLGCIAIAALMIAAMIAGAAAKRRRPRIFDLWLIVTITLSMLIMMLAYSGAVYLVGGEQRSVAIRSLRRPGACVYTALNILSTREPARLQAALTIW